MWSRGRGRVWSPMVGGAGEEVRGGGEGPQVGTEVWAVEVGVWALVWVGWGRWGTGREVCRPSPRPSSRLGSPLWTSRGHRRGAGLPPGPCVPSPVGPWPGHHRPSPTGGQDSARHPRLSLSSASSLSETHHPAHQPWPPSSPKASTAARGDLRPEQTPPAAASELSASDRHPSPCCGPARFWPHSLVCLLPLCTATHVSASGPFSAQLSPLARIYQ